MVKASLGLPKLLVLTPSSLIDFVRDMGLYYIGWDQSDLGTAIGGYTGVTNGGAYGLLIPEFINQ